MEARKTIRGYEGLYEVSNTGNVYSLARVVGRIVHRYGKRYKSNFGVGEVELAGTMVGKKRDYPAVTLYGKEGRRKTITRHRLVALAFIPNPHNYKEVNHKDGDKENNNVSNLEWCTKSYNCKHAFDAGLRMQSSEAVSKFTKKQVLKMRTLRKNGVKAKTIAEMFDCTPTSVWRIVNYKRWKNI
jgi:hypothetical protein